MVNNDRLLPAKTRQIIGRDDIIRRFIPLPSRLLLLGRPGTGKSSLARHLASLSGHPYSTLTWQRFWGPDRLPAPSEAGLVLDELHRMTAPVQKRLVVFLSRHQGFVIGTTTRPRWLSRQLNECFPTKVLLEPLSMRWITEIILLHAPSADKKEIEKITIRAGGIPRRAISLAKKTIQEKKNEK